MHPSTSNSLALHFCIVGTSIWSALITSSKPYERIHLVEDAEASCRHVLLLQSRCTTTPAAARPDPPRSVQASQGDPWARPEAQVTQREPPIALRLDGPLSKTQEGCSRPPFIATVTEGGPPPVHGMRGRP